MLWVGTSGFAYADWKPLFYPTGLATAKLLTHYATRLNSVEINYTFNRFPTEALLAGWNAKVPEGFAFALKAPRAITHQKKLRDGAELVARFFQPAARMSGPTLFQLPPTFAADVSLLEDFCALLPAGRRHAFEFRHPSWESDDILAVLEKHGAAWVAAETDEQEARLHATTPGFTYLRLRRNAYDDPQLAGWRDRIAGLRSGGADVYCFLRHDADGSNALAAERLRALPI